MILASISVVVPRIVSTACFEACRAASIHAGTGVGVGMVGTQAVSVAATP